MSKAAVDKIEAAVMEYVEELARRKNAAQADDAEDADDDEEDDDEAED